MSDASQNDARRKRINLYKKIIVIILVILILLPTLLCILLFIRMNSLQKQLDELSNKISYPPTTVVEEQSKSEPSTAPPIEVASKENETTASQPEETTSVEEETINNPSEESTSATVQTAPVLSEQEMINQAIADGRKVVYLTFDDGPCGNTNNLLDLLNKYNVKVTFFVNYHYGFEEEYKRILAEGHTLAMHSYSHVYSSVYGSYDSFVNEVSKLQEYLNELTGEKPTIFRFPGGSSNRTSSIPIKTFMPYLEDNDIVYFDWNVSSGDGGYYVSKEDCYKNVINGINSKDVSVVLMHDSTDKMTTFQAMEDILTTLQEMNALILPITRDTIPVQHTIN